jgi:hypothetical protein
VANWKRSVHFYRGLKIEIEWMTVFKEWSLSPKVIFLSVLGEYFLNHFMQFISLYFTFEVNFIESHDTS